jgi:hypothetical protein
MWKWYFIFFLGLVGSMIFPSSLNAQTDASIRIVKPGDRRNVPVGEAEVVVEINGARLEDGYTWQLYFDGVPQGPVREGLTTKLNIDNPNVLRRLKAVLYNPQGAEISAHEILIAGVVMESRADVFNRSWFVPFMLVFFIALMLIILVSLRIKLWHAS